MRLLLAIIAIFSFSVNAHYIGRIKLAVNDQTTFYSGIFTKFERFHEEQLLRRELEEKLKSLLRGSSITRINSVEVRAKGLIADSIRQQNIEREGELKATVISDTDAGPAKTKVDVWGLAIFDGVGALLHFRSETGLFEVAADSVSIVDAGGKPRLALSASSAERLADELHRHLANNRFDSHRLNFKYTLVPLQSAPHSVFGKKLKRIDSYAISLDSDEALTLTNGVKAERKFWDADSCSRDLDSIQPSGKSMF